MSSKVNSATLHPSKGKKKVVKKMKKANSSMTLRDKNLQNIIEEPVPHSFDEFEIGQKLGEGQFGAVYMGLNTENGENVAIKTIKLSTQSNNIQSVSHEIKIMKDLEHKNIVRYKTNYKDSAFLYIVMEYVEGGSLKDNIKTYGTFDEHIIATYFYQILQGLKYLHDQSIIHRDIKAANILLANGIPKLTDFGISLQSSELSSLAPEDQQRGTPYWMAPEILNLEPFTEKCDIWSLGITAIELYQGNPPYSDLNPMRAMFKIAQDPNPPPFPTNISTDFSDFLSCCLNKDVTFRKTTEQLINHPFIQHNVFPQTIPVQLTTPRKKLLQFADDSSIGAYSFNDFKQQMSLSQFEEKFDSDSSNDSILINDDNNGDINMEPLHIVPMKPQQSDNDSLMIRPNVKKAAPIDDSVFREIFNDEEIQYINSQKKTTADFCELMDEIYASSKINMFDSNEENDSKTNDETVEEDDNFNNDLYTNSKIKYPSKEEYKEYLTEKCNKLNAFLDDNVYLKESLRAQNIILQILNCTHSDNELFLEYVLPIIKRIIVNDPLTMKTLILFNIFNTLVDMIKSNKFQKEVKNKAGEIILVFFQSNQSQTQAIKLFISSGCLISLVQCFNSYQHKENSELTEILINLLIAIFKADLPKQKFSISRIFANHGMIEALINKFVELDFTKEDNLLHSMLSIFFFFAQSNLISRAHFYKENNFSQLFSNYDQLTDKYQAKLLRIIKFITLDKQIALESWTNPSFYDTISSIIDKNKLLMQSTSSQNTNSDNEPPKKHSKKKKHHKGKKKEQSDKQKSKHQKKKRKHHKQHDTDFNAQQSRDKDPIRMNIDDENDIINKLSSECSIDSDKNEYSNTYSTAEISDEKDQTTDNSKKPKEKSKSSKKKYFIEENEINTQLVAILFNILMVLPQDKVSKCVKILPLIQTMTQFPTKYKDYFVSMFINFNQHYISKKIIKRKLLKIKAITTLLNFMENNIQVNQSLSSLVSWSIVSPNKLQKALTKNKENVVKIISNLLQAKFTEFNPLQMILVILETCNDFCSLILDSQIPEIVSRILNEESESTEKTVYLFDTLALFIDVSDNPKDLFSRCNLEKIVEKYRKTTVFQIKLCISKICHATRYQFLL